MTSDHEFTLEISKQGERVAARLAEQERELESSREQEGCALVHEARETIERLLQDLRPQ